jgi:hypothetical protein
VQARDEDVRLDTSLISDIEGYAGNAVVRAMKDGSSPRT